MLLAHLAILAQAAAQTPADHWTLEALVKLGADLATIGALIFAAITMRLSSAQLKDAKSAARVSRALEFGRRWSELEFVKIRTSLYAMLQTNPAPDLAKIQAALNGDPNTKAAMRLVLNFYEEMGVVFNHGELDEAILADLFRSQVRFICSAAWPFIDYLQQHSGQKTACEQMLKMNQKI
jgi:hypothetical protein